MIEREVTAVFKKAVKSHPVVAGVCAGLAHKLDLNMTGLRWVVALEDAAAGMCKVRLCV